MPRTVKTPIKQANLKKKLNPAPLSYFVRDGVSATNPPMKEQEPVTVQTSSVEEEIKAVISRHGASAAMDAFKRVLQELTFPELMPDQIAAVIARGRERPWSERGEQHASPFDWVREVYAEWIPGLLQGHLQSADLTLYQAFRKAVQRKGLPADLNVPTKSEVIASDIQYGGSPATTPAENARRLGRLAGRYRRLKSNVP